MPKSVEQDLINGKTLAPTALGSAELRTDWSEKLKEEALFSARTTSKAYLDMIKKRLTEVAMRDASPQSAEKILQRCLADLGYNPATGFPGDKGKIPPATPKSITDLSSSPRIQLIIDTNVKRARSMGQMAAGESPVFMRTNPAWKLERTGARKKPRGDWKKRWQAAGAAVGWKHAAQRRFVALKTSPIWEALGKGEGGFTDALGSPFPPFAFGSGMAWTNVGRKEWETICDAEGIDNGLADLDAQTKVEYAKRREIAQRPLKTAAIARLREISASIGAEQEREARALYARLRAEAEKRKANMRSATKKATQAWARLASDISQKRNYLANTVLMAMERTKQKEGNKKGTALFDAHIAAAKSLALELERMELQAKEQRAKLANADRAYRSGDFARLMNEQKKSAESLRRNLDGISERIKSEYNAFRDAIKAASASSAQGSETRR